MKNKLFTLVWIFLFVCPHPAFLQTPITENRDSISLEEEMDIHEAMEMEENFLDTFEVKEVEESPSVEEKIFKVVEDIPSYFPECKPKILSLEALMKCNEEKFLEKIYQNLEYPTVAQQLKIEGKVIAQFVIEKDGTLQDINIIKDIGGGCGEEVKRVLQLLNEQKEIKWTPKARGKPVKIRFTIPVGFNL